MCLAKLYVQANGGDPGTDLLMENVAHVEVDGDKIRVTSLFGGTEEVQARVTSIDFVEGRLVLQSVEP
jgi:predicted RNA-binding protein